MQGTKRQSAFDSGGQHVASVKAGRRFDPQNGMIECRPYLAYEKAMLYSLVTADEYNTES